MKHPFGSESGSVLPGLKPVTELLEQSPEKIDTVYLRKGRPNPESSRLLDLCREYGVRFNLVDEEGLARLSCSSGHQGVIARLKETPTIPLEEMLETALQAPLPLIVALDQVKDPGNIGTLARTAYAMGCAGLLLPKHNSAFLGPGARRSAAGALERLPICEVPNLGRAVDSAVKSGFHAFAAQKVNESLDPLQTDLPLPALIVLGGEENGIRPGVAKHCEQSLCIPFRRDFDSLNVAQAGAILIACFARTAH